MSHDTPQRPMTDEVWHRAELLDRLIEHLGVAGAAARLDGGDALLDAHAKCLDCTVKQECESLLTDPNALSTPNACPNLSFLARCVSLRRPHAGPAKAP